MLASPSIVLRPGPSSWENLMAAAQQRRPPASPSPALQSPESERADEEIEFDRKAAGLMIPDLFTQVPPVRDPLATATSTVQDETIEACLPFLSGEDKDLQYNEHGVPRLNRERHIKFLHQCLGRLPGRFVAADASRPWFLYWCLSALTMLGEDEAYEVVDRKAMWRWLCSLKQPDGGFQVCLGGEEDIRGAYCAAVIITLLRLPLDLTPESPAYAEDGSVNLFTGVADYVQRCQTYEGGISGQPHAEAHGAYAFCALGCLALLDHPGRSISSYLDVPRLIAWLSARQYAPEGGFSGRTNKLVDGCYSHWVGGCFPLIEACLNSSNSISGPMAAGGPATTATATNKQRLPSADESLFSREGLIRYILCCCQDQTKRGGLRDKPGKMSDAYHSCYVLSGLSSAQHQWELDELNDDDNGNDSNELMKEAAAERESEAVWAVLPYLDGPQVFDNNDRVRPIHPIYAIPQPCVKAMKEYFDRKQGF
ncbi:hypothetical protein VTH06DRAFT_7835 [Thermothelomyces fergusii]